MGLGGWAALAPLARAVSAYAILSVKSDRKQIQHLEGGIVEALHVSEGELVKKKPAFSSAQSPSSISHCLSP